MALKNRDSVEEIAHFWATLCVFCRFTPDEVEDMFKGADSCLYDDGLDYAAFVKIIKNGEEREEE